MDTTSPASSPSHRASLGAATTALSSSSPPSPSPSRSADTRSAEAAPDPDGQPAAARPHDVPALTPLRWVALGWNDLIETRFRGLFYGLTFAAMGIAIEAIFRHQWQLTLGLTAGFFVLGPFICCGLYELSRQRARGEMPSLGHSLTAWSRNPKSIGLFAVILTFLFVIWVRVSVVLFALLSTKDFPTLKNVIGQIVSLQNAEFLVVWALVGSAFATLAFAISVVSVPMMLDRNTDALEAIFASARALWANPAAMAVWAALIIGTVGVGLVLWLPLLALATPVIGHASWHAYRELLAAQPKA